MKYLIIICTLLFTVTMFGQDARGDKMKKIEAEKIAFITSALELTPEEAKVFWPVYDEYSKSSRDLRKEIKRPNKGEEKPDYTNMTDKEAGEVLEMHLYNEEKRVQLKSDLIQDLDGKMPKYKIIKLFFAEEQFKKEVLSQIKENMSNNSGDRRGMNKGEHRGN